MPTGDGLPAVDPNLIYTDPNEYHRQMEARQEARVKRAVDAATPGVVTPLSGMAKQMARAHRPDIWASYGPEIETTMAQLPPQSRADVDTWKRVIDYVAGQHVDELARKKAEELIRNGSDTGMLRTNGAPPLGSDGSSASPMRKLFADRPDIRDFYKDAGITVGDLVEHGSKMGHDEAKWSEMVSRKFKNAPAGAV